MVANLKLYKSHPERPLIEHLISVKDNIRFLSDLSFVEIAALLHDVGKINPNFQNKLSGKDCGYTSHAYLSAFVFYLACALNQKLFSDKFNIRDKEQIISITSIIAHHHGNLPNLNHILNENECNKLFDFLDKNPNIPFKNFINQFIKVNDFEGYLYNSKARNDFKILGIESKKPLELFLKTQFGFASLIQADKKDASDYQQNINKTKIFFEEYSNKLASFISKFNQNSDLNILRTKIRQEAESNMIVGLETGNRIFSLTSPTGSGKTIMLLSLADKIINAQPSVNRIIYTLPFLSITEQVEKITNDIFGDNNPGIRRIDSKAINNSFQKIQNKLEDSPEYVNELISEHYAEDFFDYPFIITTFVKVFETFLSNKNHTLLKLPNFSKTIFLIDEIQALPPRLYGFFIALIDAFCKKFDSYAIISTATMPEFKLPTNKRPELKNLFSEYTVPFELLNLNYFYEKQFDRYDIQIIKEPLDTNKLADLIKEKQKSSLVILNTIQDTIDLFNLLNKDNTDQNVHLLNTRFTPDDRNKKIEFARNTLKKNKHIILITTQLIEAGVDIDFPNVFRDLCPLPNIIQSAGRCNRNNNYREKGKVFIFKLHKDNKKRASLIYRGKDKRFLDYIESSVGSHTYTEPDLLDKQKDFFKEIKDNTIFGKHYFANDQEMDLVDKIKNIEFEELGKFRLIDESIYGIEFRYYIPKNNNDSNFEEFCDLVNNLKKIKHNNFEKKKILKIQIEQKLKEMSGRIVQIRLGKYDSPPIPESELIYGIYKIKKSDYSSRNGVQLTNVNQII